MRNKLNQAGLIKRRQNTRKNMNPETRNDTTHCNNIQVPIESGIQVSSDIVIKNEVIDDL